MKTNDLNFKTEKTFDKEVIIVNIRLNDCCNNGHQDFSITGTICEAGKPRTDKYLIGCGCIHDEILKYFPEFKIFVDLHLCDCAGIPMHAVENGFYHLRNGFENVKPFEDSFEEEFCKYYRINRAQFEKLNMSENKIEYAILLKELGILNQWNDDAKEAINLLEKLTGNEFINDSVKSQYNCPSIDEINDFKEKKEAGYYSLENKKAREIDRIKQEKQKVIDNIVNSAKIEIDKATTERDVKLWLINRIDMLANKPIKNGFRLTYKFDNYIYYNHSNTLSFNWLTYKETMSEHDFDIICNSLSSSDFEKLPTGIVFDLKNIKQFTNR